MAKDVTFEPLEFRILSRIIELFLPCKIDPYVFSRVNLHFIDRLHFAV